MKATPSQSPEDKTLRREEKSQQESSQQESSQQNDFPHNASAQDASTQKKPLSTADKLKFAGLLLFIGLIVVIGVLLIPYFQYLLTEEGRLELVAMIQDAGIAGVGMCLALQFVQIVVAIIPGEVAQLAIGAIYGPIAGSFVTLLGALISSIFIFFVVRKLGAPFVQGMIGSKNTKIMSFFKEDRRLNTIVFILFLIPGLPKDVFTYLVPLTTMRPINFFVLSTLGRTPGIAASAFIGSAAVQGDYTQAIIVGIIAGGLGLLGIVFNKRILTFIDKAENRFKRNSSDIAKPKSDD